LYFFVQREYYFGAGARFRRTGGWKRWQTGIQGDIRSPNVTQVAVACPACPWNMSGLLLSITTALSIKIQWAFGPSEFRNKWRNGPQFVRDLDFYKSMGPALTAEAATRDVQLCMLPVRTAKQATDLPGVKQE